MSKLFGLIDTTNLGKPSFPKGMGWLVSIVGLLSAMALGTLAGQAVTAILGRFIPARAASVLGGITAYGTGGIAGVAGFAVTTGLIGNSPESQGSGF